VPPLRCSKCEPVSYGIGLRRFEVGGNVEPPHISSRQPLFLLAEWLGSGRSPQGGGREGFPLVVLFSKGQTKYSAGA
jgi:hypothetical protein